VAKRRKSKLYVSRGGDKLDGALTSFDIDVCGLTAVDLGANVGGFTDCLLQHGAAKVYAVDTAYGVFEWKLRQDQRVVTIERTNALHFQLPERVQVAVVDVGWTPMARILPVALQCLDDSGIALALLKPQYEAQDSELENGVVRTEILDGVVERVLVALSGLGIHVEDQVESKIPGTGGNREFFLRILGGKGA
jgi:23S rRNA (cytidine1920-2'-O)/16S rRNA (cytidine1409-2'-O)-methyltransferase